MDESSQSPPLTSSSTAKPRNRAAGCYQRGLQLAAAHNFDYAHVMFAEAAGIEPDNLAFVDAMLRNLRAKHPEQRRKSGQLFGVHASKGIKKALAEKSWNEVLRQGFTQLQNDPWNVATLRAMAEACAALHYNEVELAYLKQALDAAPKSADVNRHCARSLARMGQFDQAIACWHRVETLLGRDSEAARAISQLSDEKLKYPNGRPPMAAAPAVQKSEESAAAEDAATTAAMQPSLAVTTGTLETPIAALKEHTDRTAAGETSRRGIPWLEASLVLAGLALLMQLFPAVGTVAWEAVNVSQWPGALSFAANLFLAICLVAVLVGTEWGGTPRGQRWMASIGGALLAVELWPWFGRRLLEVIDVRNWSQLVWFLVTCVTLIILLSVRFGPDRLWKMRRR